MHLSWPSKLRDGLPARRAGHPVRRDPIVARARHTLEVAHTL